MGEKWVLSGRGLVEVVTKVIKVAEVEQGDCDVTLITKCTEIENSALEFAYISDTRSYVLMSETRYKALQGSFGCLNCTNDKIGDYGLWLRKM